jgi:hypothetical protein
VIAIDYLNVTETGLPDVKIRPVVRSKTTYAGWRR